MEKEEKIRIETPLAVAGVTLLPIVKTSLHHWQLKDRLLFFGSSEPVSVVVVSAQARRAFRISGEEVPLDQLGKEVPSIEEVLRSI